MLKQLFFSVFFSLIFVNSYSQDYTVNGTVKDQKTNDPVIGAAVFQLYRTDNGTATDTAGFFSLSFSRKNVLIKVAFIGYKDTILEMSLISDTTLTVFLKSETEIEEVEIEDDEIFWKPDDKGIKGLSKEIKAELADVEEDIKAEDVIIPLISKYEKPGSLKDIYLRNGQGYNQDLIFLDGAKIYRSNLMFDFLPFINDESIKDFDHYYGNYPARFSGQMSSILDIAVKEGSFKKYSANINLNFAGVGISTEGPVLFDKSSFFISARKSYFNNSYSKLFMTDYTAGNEYWAQPAFFDLNFKYTHKLTENDKVYFSFFTNKNDLKTEVHNEYEDSIVYSYTKKMNDGYTNTAMTLNFEHVFSPDLILDASLIFSRYNLKNTISGDSMGLLNSDRAFINRYNAEYISGNEDYVLKMCVNYNPHPEHHMKLGGSVINHHFRPVKAELTINDFEHSVNIDTSWNAEASNAQEYIIYAEDNFSVNDVFFMNAGVHFSAFNSNGQAFYSVQPRLYAEYKLFRDLSFNASYANYKQYIHYSANHSTGLSSDIFIPASSDLLPVVTNRFAAGVDFKLPFNIFIKADAFYDNSSNLLEYKDGYSFFDYPGTEILTGMNLSERVESVKSNSYGIRVLLNKSYENLRLNIGHTITNNDRQFVNINFGETFQYRYSNRHDFKLNLSYIISENFNIFMNWMYRSGNYITVNKQSYIPYNYNSGTLETENNNITIYTLDGELTQSLGFRNDYQLPAYHRLDVGANYNIENHTFGIHIYNLYNKRNPDFIDFKNSVFSESGNDSLIKYSVMPFFPTVSYSYRFN